MTQCIAEIVRFKTISGTDESTFLNAAQEASAFLQTCPGFIRRCLSKSDDGEWLDHVEWRSLSDAENAAQLFPSQAGLLAFMTAIDAETIEFRHAPILVKVG